MKQSGRALVGIMVAAVIALILTFVMLKGSSIFPGTKQEPERADKLGKTLVGKSLLKARDTACLDQLQSDRLSIQTLTDPVEETKPASLADAKITGSAAECPIGHEPYVYDPATGTIHCVHPGHEKY